MLLITYIIIFDAMEFQYELWIASYAWHASSIAPITGGAQILDKLGINEVSVGELIRYVNKGVLKHIY
jgi:hypothetical protein